MPVTHIAPLACYAIALYLGGEMIMAGMITVGDFAAFTGYLGLIIWPVMGLGYLINTLQRGAASLERIRQFLEQVIYETRRTRGGTPAGCAGNIIQNLTFSYPNATIPALRNLSCHIAPGAVVGIAWRNWLR